MRIGFPFLYIPLRNTDQWFHRDKWKNNTAATQYQSDLSKHQNVFSDNSLPDPQHYRYSLRFIKIPFSKTGI